MSLVFPVNSIFKLSIYRLYKYVYVSITTFLGSSISPNPCASLTENAVSTHDVIESGTLRRNSVFPLYLQKVHVYLMFP